MLGRSARMSVEMLTPWYAVDDDRERAGMERQLVREVGPRHRLFGTSASLIARRQDNDDCLFQLPDGRVADVHLTWRQGQEQDPRWPSTAIYDTLEEWVEKVMRPASADWSDH
jgi:hypothetical protein